MGLLVQNLESRPCLVLLRLIYLDTHCDAVFGTQPAYGPLVAIDNSLDRKVELRELNSRGKKHYTVLLHLAQSLIQPY